MKNPTEIGLLIELLLLLKEICGSLTIGMESTGTYGDAVRRAMTEALLEVHRISGKSVSDYKEIFDGVPSQHDGKDAAMIAELTCFGKGTPWPYSPLSEADQRLRHQVLRMDAFRLQATQWTNHLEGLLARHWPEVTELLSLRSKTLLMALKTYGSPAALAADPEAAQRLYRWSGGSLKPKKIDCVLESARTTQGLPVGAAERRWIQEIATEAVSALKEKTAQDRFTRAVRSIDHRCRDNRHLPIREQHQKLNQKLRGHYAYYGVTGNSAALARFLHEVRQRWRRWLNRRNNIRSLTWEKFLVILRRYPLAPNRAVRSTLRYAANP